MAHSVDDFLKFVDSSPSPFHTVQSARKRLISAGFEEIRERDSWTSFVRPGGLYYLTRNGSSLVAFAVGKKWTPGQPAAIIGAHTDSPCLRIKPVSKKQNQGFLQVGVETYGGGLWHTWFDRDLSLAGRIMVKGANGTFRQRLVKIDRPILRVPTLAIHLDRQATFTPNKETHLFPITGLVSAELDRFAEAKDTSESQPLKALNERHHPGVVKLLADEAGVEPDDIADFEIVLYDTQKACVGGLNSDFIFAARLDNLGMSYCATMGLINSVAAKRSLDDEQSVRLISLFDNEEIGSQTTQGAMSNLLPAVLKRLSAVDSKQKKTSKTAYEEMLAMSFLISADMAHSVHPNYPEKYESDHRPLINKGTVIKINANARYTTNSPGLALIEEIARRAKSVNPEEKSGVPLQLFVVRNDSTCGSTIGPMLSSVLGMRAIDLGNPQLSMHSIRETGGVQDIDHSVRLFESFFEHYNGLEKRFYIDHDPSSDEAEDYCSSTELVDRPKRSH